MRLALAATFLLNCMVSAAAAEPVNITELTISDIIAVGVANGASSDEVLALLDEFPNVSAFESKRLKEEAVSKIVSSGSAVSQNGFPIVEIVYMAPVSQFDFDSSSFGVCVPVVLGEDLGFLQDIPLRSSLDINLDDGPFARDALGQEGRYRNRDLHPKRMYDGDDFYWQCKNAVSTRTSYFSTFPVVFKDVAKAEDFDALVEFGGGGYVTARVRCLLDRVKPQGDLVSVRCSPTEVALFHVSDTELGSPEVEVKLK